MGWTKADIPSQTGKLAIVTGSYGGLGYEVVLGLAEAGATVIIAGRSEAKGKEALKKLKTICPNGKISFSKLDLGSLASVTKFCTDFNSKYEALDILVNNAGIMMPPNRVTTEDGFEIQIQTNHLSHFALTAQLLPALRQSADPRVVNVASIASKRGEINFDDLHAEKSYNPVGTYAQSKFANLLFTFELQRKSDTEDWGLMSIAAHPGLTKTDLVSNGPGNSTFLGRATNLLIYLFGSNVSDGALPILYAATSAEAQPSGYYGPQGFQEMKGKVGVAGVPAKAKDLEVAKRFWDVSVTLTNAFWSKL